MVSQAVPAPMVPLTGNEMALQPAPYVAMDLSEEGASDYGVLYASFAVCALAVAGVSMSKQSVQSNRRGRVAAPVMQLREEVDTGLVQAVQPQGGQPPARAASRRSRHRSCAG